VTISLYVACGQGAGSRSTDLDLVTLVIQSCRLPLLLTRDPRTAGKRGSYHRMVSTLVTNMAMSALGSPEAHVPFLSRG
jgi:hypothetical protein